MFNDYSQLSEEELDEKIQDLQQKMLLAHSQGHLDMVEKLRYHLEYVQFELLDRLERERFDMISERTPDSFIIGEDEDEDTDLHSSENN